MSISTRIQSISEHLEKDWESIKNIGGDTSVNNNIENISSVLEEIYKDLPITTEEGITLTLNNTKKGKMNIVYKGNTSQSLVPSGYTQVDYITSDGNSYIDTGKTLGDNFKIETKFIHNQQLSNEQPIISTWVSSYLWFNLYIASNNQLRFYTVGNHMTANPTLTLGSINTVSYSRSSNHWIGVLNGEEVSFNATLSTSNPTTFKIFARGDNTLGSYVSIYRLKLYEDNVLTMDLIPCYRNNDNVIGMYDIVNNIFYTNSGTGNFTYGSVVPNPDYPQDIQVVTGNNSIRIANNDNTQSQTYPINLGNIELCKIGNRQDYIEKNTGKNLFDNDYANNSSIYTITIEAENPLGTVNCYELQLKPNTTYTLSINMNGYAKANSWLAGLCYADGTFISYLQYGTMSEITTQTFTTDNTGKIYVGERYGIGTNDRMPLFLETALIQIEENDRATEYEHYGEKGNWYKYSAIGKVVFDGSEDWNYQSQFPRFQLTSLSPVPLNDANLFCSHYIKGQTADTDYVCSVASGTGYSQFLVHDERFSTKETYNTWLSSNNVSVYYVLAKSTYTKITDTTLLSQLETIKYSYDNQTNISQTNADLGFIIRASALLDANKYIDYLEAQVEVLS